MKTTEVMQAVETMKEQITELVQVITPREKLSNSRVKTRLERMEALLVQLQFSVKPAPFRDVSVISDRTRKSA